MINNAQPIEIPQQHWKKKYPAIVTGLFSFIQLVLTLLIIACEIASMLIDIITATVYVGLWAGLFFLIACISQAISSCCCRTRGFATYTLIVQVIAMFFALCVIAFDSLYIEEPTTCFFSSSQCNSAGTARGLLYSTDNFNNIKMTAIKIQLGAGCFMWLICLIYIVVYIITTIRVYRAERPSNIYPQGKPPYPTFPDTSKGVLSAPPMNSYVPPIIVPHNAPGTINVVCPTCSAAMSVTATKRPPMY